MFNCNKSRYTSILKICIYFCFAVIYSVHLKVFLIPAISLIDNYKQVLKTYPCIAYFLYKNLKT